MKLNRFQLYILGLIVFSLPMIIYKWVWLSKARETVGRVLYIDEPRRRNFGNTYPVIEYYAEDKRFLFRGRYNSQHQPGDSLPILYMPGNPKNKRLNTFWSCWIEVVLLNGFIMILWTFLFLKGIIEGKNFWISKKGINVLKEEDPIPYAEIVPPQDQKLLK
jgi:hypothetical protein